MAQDPSSKNDDPAALAFSAVENALKESVFTKEDAKPKLKGPGVSRKTEPAPAPSERLKSAEKIAKRTGKVANDDSFANARVLYGLQKRPSRMPMLLAFVASIVWLGLTGIVGWLRFGSQISQPDATANFIASADFAGLLAIMALPVLGFFGIAILVRRAQDLRIAAATMTEAAIRMTEPETTAADKVATVGQAVRREVNALGDGLERALSRAGELEVMVHNEVTSLEKTYSENETRLRGLIQELAEQRDSVTTNAERVREAIAEAHALMVSDLDRIGTSIGGTITERGDRMRDALESVVGKLENTFGDRTSSFVDLVESRTSNLIGALDERAEKIDTSLESRTNGLNEILEHHAENFSSEIQARLGHLSGELDSQTAMVVSAIDERTGNLIAALGDGNQTLADTIEARGSSLLENFNNSTGAVVSELTERGASINKTLEDLTGRIVGDLSGNTDRAEKVLNALARKLNETVAVQVNSLESRFQTALIEIGDLIDTSSESARQNLLEASTSSLASITGRVDEVSVILDTRLQAMDNVVGEKGEKLIEALDTHSESFASRANLLETALSDKSASLDNALASRTEALVTGISQKTEMLEHVLGENGSAIEAAFDTRTGKLLDGLSERAQSLDSKLDGQRKAIEESFDARAEALVSGISEHRSGLQGMLENERAAIEHGIDERATTLTATISEKQAGFQNALSATTQEFSRIVEERAGEMAETVDEKSKSLSETIGGHTREFAEKLSTRTQQLSEAIGARTREFGEVLDIRTDQLSERLTRDTSALETSLDQRTDHLSQTIGTRTEELASTIDSHGNVIEGRINSVLGNVNATMDKRATEVSELITSKISEINTTIGVEVDGAIARLDNAETGLSARLDQAAGKISQSARGAADSIETVVEGARSSITTMVDERLGTLPEAITARAEITADRLSELNTSLNTSITTAMSELEAGAERVEETISNRISTVASSISTDVEQTAARMDVAVRTALEQIRGAARQIEDLVEIKAVDTAAELNDKMVAMQRAVTEQSAAFADIIDAKSEQLDRALRSHGNILNDALKSAAQESEQLVDDTTGRMLNNLSNALGKLNDSNLMLQRILDTATGNLTTIEEKVATHTGEYSETVKHAVAATEEAGQMVGQHVGAFQSTVAGLIDQFSSMVRDLDTQTSNIDKAAHTLQDAGNFSIDTLENRRGAMEALAESFTARADDIDERMRTFAQSIAETVNATEGRLAGARRAMEEALAATSDVVAGQIETFSKTAGDEGERANERLRQAQQAMLREVEQALAEATTKFNDTATAMRSTAGQVSKELEATRSELQRGVLELPEETRASAAAMRRVVAEQIEALNELNNIVRAQPATHDLNARRNSAPAARPAPTQERAPQRTQPVEDAPIEPRRPESNGQRDANTGLRTQPRVPPVPASLRHPAQAQLAQPQQASQPQQAGGAQKGNGNGADWLRDVLRNASASQQAEADRSSGLSGLTNDIARAIESDALWDAWQRYQAGEQAAFSRRLYTLSGQATYEDVRRKLQQDREFSNTAKAYLEEFEQLLQRAGSSESPSSEMRKLLMSDRGKVYTMLAHASGRLV